MIIIFTRNFRSCILKKGLPQQTTKEKQSNLPQATTVEPSCRRKDGHKRNWSNFENWFLNLPYWRCCRDHRIPREVHLDNRGRRLGLKTPLYYFLAVKKKVKNKHWPLFHQLRETTNKMKVVLAGSSSSAPYHGRRQVVSERVDDPQTITISSFYL